MSSFKLEILRAISEHGAPRIHKMSILGRPDQQGYLEWILTRSLSSDERASAGRDLEELIQAGFVNPTYSDIVSPEDWYELSEAGRIALETGILDGPAPRRHPPTGTITFLFTDVEGSSERWEREPEHMKKAMAIHDQILRTAIKDNGGYIFKTGGDEFCAAFENAPDAVRAAIEAQLRLVAGEDQDALPRIRIGLHSGTAELRGNDYYGPTVNRVARIRNAAKGRQTLISEATYGLARDSFGTC